MSKISKFVHFDQFTEYRKKINWSLFVLISIFTIGSWLDISGIWCELPLIVDTLPEGWRLPSILTITSQLGHVGPLLYLCLRRFFPRALSFSNAIIGVLGLGSASCILLAFFWDKTEFILDESRSIYLYIFNFSLSMLDSLSTVTFLPYIGEHFSKEYIIPNYIGESLSALIPGVLSIIQGIGHPEECFDNNTSNGNYTLIEERVKPNFSVRIYFILLSILIAICLVSFCLIHFTSLFDSLRKEQACLGRKQSQVYNLEDPDLSTKLEDGEKTQKSTPRHVIKIFMTVSFLTSFIQYGFLPGLMSYSNMPYGSNIMYLSVNLANIFLPVSILFSMGSNEVSTKRILIELSIPMAISFYIISIAIMSPCPPFVNAKYNLGGYFMVLCWVLLSSILIRVRCLIATKLEKYGRNSLLIFGISSQFGQVLGGLIIFVLVDVMRLFKDKPKCSPFDYCQNYQ
ncbi:unnamed protein product [Brachionus calyciflorus]|uniref:Riboflavin transporter n=1 Tax=Brachionus calyciflorus TaxID=104777 RepID=A0A813XDH2_9BILA|nr:unnamed protein product [Brachionus calyciflorus]